MRVMYDALPGAFHTIPADAEIVAGYIDSADEEKYPIMRPDLWALYPNALHVEIATQPGATAGHVADVERGDMNAQDAVEWVVRRRSAGYLHPTVYCSEAVWGSVRAAFQAAGVPEPDWWIAGYPGSVGAQNLYPGSVAHQWGSDPTDSYDISVVADNWPGIDDQEHEVANVYIQKKSAANPEVWVTDGLHKRHVLTDEWNFANYVTGGKVAGQVLLVSDEWWDSIPVAGTTGPASGFTVTSVVKAT